jgi:hypothetical protein
MRARGLVETIHGLEDIFDRCGLRRSYGGAIAYAYYGPPDSGLRLQGEPDLDNFFPGRTGIGATLVRLSPQRRGSLE